MHLVTGMAASSGQVIDLTLGDNLGEFEEDAIRIRQVRVNLLSNSMKFARCGTYVQIAIGATPPAPRMGTDTPRMDHETRERVGDRACLWTNWTGYSGHLSNSTCSSGASPVGWTRILPERRTGRVVLVGEADSVRAVRTSWLEATGFEVLASSDLDQALGRVPQFTPDVLLIDSSAYPMELVLLAETIVTPVVVPMPVVTTAWRTALYEKCGDAMVFGLPCPPGAVLAALDRALAGGNHGPRGGNGPVHVGRKARTGKSPSMHRH